MWGFCKWSLPKPLENVKRQKANEICGGPYTILKAGS